MDRGKGCIKKRSNNSIGLEFTYKGERFRPVLKGLSADKKAHWKRAEEILLQVQGDIASDRQDFFKFISDYPKLQKYRKGSNITIEEKLLTWLDRKDRNCERTTYKLYKSVIEKRLVEQFGSLALSDLTAEQVREWMYSLNISAKTVNNALTPLRGIYEEAFEDGLIDKNPLLKIRNLKVHKEEPEPFTPSEIEKILAACEGQFHNLVQFGISTGLRTEELIGLKWKYVDLIDGKVHIRHVVTREGTKDRPKTPGSVRQVDLYPPARMALEAQKLENGDAEYVFHNPYTGKRWKNADRIRRIWVRVLEKAGVPYRKPYTMRHTYASIMLSSGYNPMYVAQQMGHKDWGMIRSIYGRYIREADKALQDRTQHFMAAEAQADTQLAEVEENEVSSNPVTPTNSN